MPSRDGQRKKRLEHKPHRMPKLGYYCIFTDTEETEKNYFDGLKESLPEDIKNNITIKVVPKISTGKLVEAAKSMVTLDSQYYETWIVFDRDQVKNFDSIIADAEKNGIRVAWSNPCLEIWFYAYFGKMPFVMDSVDCCEQFGQEYKKRTGIKYKKSDKDIYLKLNRYGNEDNAIKIAERKYKQQLSDFYDSKEKPSEMCSCTTVHILIKEIKSKIHNI